MKESKGTHLLKQRGLQSRLHIGDPVGCKGPGSKDQKAHLRPRRPVRALGSTLHPTVSFFGWASWRVDQKGSSSVWSC